MKEKIIEKEIKKAQKKGIYNPKLKLGIVGLILVIGTVIGVSYAYYTSNPSNVLTIEGTVSKKINIRVEAGEHGAVESMEFATAQTDYGTSTRTFKIGPNEGYQYKDVTCTEDNAGKKDVTTKVNPSYSNNTLTVTPRTSQNIVCTVEFERVRSLEEIKADIIRTAKSGTPNFSTGCPTSTDSSCSGVYKMTDDSNKDSYYFREAVDNNYVQFGRGTTSDNNTTHDLIWRIVRINGDGSIRLVLDGDIGTSEFCNNIYAGRKIAGYTYDNSAPCTNSNPCKVEYNGSQFNSNNTGTSSPIKSFLEEWYLANLKDYDQYVDYGIYCNDTSYGSGDEGGALYYGPHQRLQNGSQVAPQLTCPDPTAGDNKTSSDRNNGYHTYGGVYKLKIGLLSADEIVLAGFKPTSSSGVTDSNYLYYTSSSSSNFWSLSPDLSRMLNADVFHVNLSTRSLYSDMVDFTSSARPVINIRTEGLKATGEGKKDEPFVISIN